MKESNSFKSKIGFILATAGSAVGLGNLWRFPYLAAKYGGGVFLVIYIALAVTFGFSLMLAETAIGRRTGKSVIGAYTTIDKRFAPLGWLASLVPVIITPYYCVIGGWVLRYLTSFVSGNGSKTAGDGSYFSNFIADEKSATIFFLVFLVVTTVIVMLGVDKGIEKLSKLMMPALILLIIGIAVYTMTRPGALDGVAYYFLPNFEGMTVEKLMKTIAAAMGQLFYSMSIAMGILVTYGSYMRKQDALVPSVRQVGVFDTGVAILAGLIIVPSVFVFSGGTVESLNAGPGLMFITLPNVFADMAGGQVIGALFFVLVALAALTSSISLMETVVSIIMEKFKLKRIAASLITFVILLVVGMLSVLGYSAWDTVTILGYQILDFFDFISNNIMMPIVAFFTCLLIGYVAKPKYVKDEILESQKTFKSEKLFNVMIKVVCPICMIIILITPFVTSL